MKLRIARKILANIFGLVCSGRKTINHTKGQCERAIRRYCRTAWHKMIIKSYEQRRKIILPSEQLSEIAAKSVIPREWL